MNYKTSNGQTSAACSGVIENEDGYLPQPIIDMRKISHLSRLLDLCRDAEQASDLRPAHAFFWAIFKNMKGVILRNGNLVLISRSKKGLRQARWGRYLFIEQNPKTGSKWAGMGTGTSTAESTDSLPMSSRSRTVWPAGSGLSRGTSLRELASTRTALA